MAGKFHVFTFGCQMNKNDSERITGLLCSLGLEVAAKAPEADVIVVNTCSVRQSAEDRVYGQVRNWQKLRAKKPNLIIAITGCMPGRDKDGKLKSKIRGVDLFFPIEELPLLPERLKGLNFSLFCHSPEKGNPGRSSGGLVPHQSIGGGTLDPRFHGDDGAKEEYWDIAPFRSNKLQVFVTIQTGCDNFCTYCVVPYTRGRQKNRLAKEILAEISEAVNAGAKEVILLGQVVNNYQAPDIESFNINNPFKSVDDFAAFLWEINQIAGLERLHWTAADPQYFSEAQIQALALPKQVNYLHLPAQSGDNEILRKMNRKYTREEYIDLVKRIRAVKPDIAIGTDLIVGFCGEIEEQFKNTMALYRECDFDISYPAMYSERSSTAAARAFKDDVPRAEKKRRWEAVQELMEEITYRKNQAYVGKVVSVLVEGWETFSSSVIPTKVGIQSQWTNDPGSCFYGDDDTGICSGHSGEMKLVQFLGSSDLVGQIVDVKITRADVWVLKGER